MADNATPVEEPPFNPESWEGWLCVACYGCGICSGLAGILIGTEGVWTVNI